MKVLDVLREAGMTVEQVARELGISKSRVQQIEHEALSKFKRAWVKLERESEARCQPR